MIIVAADAGAQHLHFRQNGQALWVSSCDTEQRLLQVLDQNDISGYTVVWDDSIELTFDHPQGNFAYSVCRNCGHFRKDHPDPEERCLFSPRTFERLDPLGEFLAWRKANGCGPLPHSAQL